MSQERIAELELQLAAATAAVATLTLANTGLTEQLEESELRAKKLRRNSKRDESSLKQQLATAQSRRG
jgi:hypothetical protein